LLDAILLEDFIRSFVGYGNLDSHVWFIGMEEGGGATENEVLARLETWTNRGRMQVEDVHDFHIACQQIQADQPILLPQEIALTNWLDQHFLPGADLQFTWERIIRLMRSNLGLDLVLEEMRQYQVNGFARIESRLAILELFPLPSPKSRIWNYGPVSAHKRPENAFPAGPWTDTAYLQSRRSYRHQIYQARRDLLRTLIDDHQPAAVVFYGESLRNEWQEIAGLAIANHDYGLHGVGPTRYMILPHPNAWGTNTNLLFQQAGFALRSAGIVM
jgi:hypothetical protein